MDQIEGADSGQINVIFGTYQSGHRVADGPIRETKGERPRCSSGTRPHRTAGLRRKRNAKPNRSLGWSQISRYREGASRCAMNNDELPRHLSRSTSDSDCPRYMTRRIVAKDLPLRLDSALPWMTKVALVAAGGVVRRKLQQYLEACCWRTKWPGICSSATRIIAVGVNDPELAFNHSHILSVWQANGTQSFGVHGQCPSRRPTTRRACQYATRALAMGGATKGLMKFESDFASCIVHRVSDEAFR